MINTASFSTHRPCMATRFHEVPELVGLQRVARWASFEDMHLQLYSFVGCNYYNKSRPSTAVDPRLLMQLLAANMISIIIL